MVSLRLDFNNFISVLLCFSLCAYDYFEYITSLVRSGLSSGFVVIHAAFTELLTNVCLKFEVSIISLIILEKTT